MGLFQDLGDQFENLCERIRILGVNVDSLSRKYRMIDRRVADNEAVIDALHKRMAAMESTIDKPACSGSCSGRDPIIEA